MAAKKNSTRRKGGSGKGASGKSRAARAGQSAQPGAGQTIEGAAEEPRKAKSAGPLEFASQVRSEMSKVTWTSRNETMISTVMVLIMVAIMSVFFFLVDQTLQFGVCNILPVDCVARDTL